MPSPICSRLAALRAEMAAHGIDAYRIGTADDHDSEYVAPHFGARAWFSGFNGSAGTLIVTAENADLWTDGRYFLQAEAQLCGSGIRLRRSGEDGVPTVAQYLADAFPNGAVIGFDGKTVSVAESEQLREKLPANRFRFVSEFDFADRLWQDRPPMPQSTLWKSEVGESRAEKLSRIRAELRKSSAENLLICSLAEIAWTLNLRGSDVAYTPVFYAYLLLRPTDAVLFAESRISPELSAELQKDGVTVLPYSAVTEFCRKLPSLVCDRKINTALYDTLQAQLKLQAHTPIWRMKAIKNDAEQQNERTAHLFDGLAVTKLIYRLKNDGNARTELAVCEELEALRRLAPSYRMPSFGTISAFGAHGAIVHYKPDAESDAPIANGFLLLDTGGHYTEGSTDLTRTIALGAVSEQQKAHYTAVLRGNLAVAMAAFRRGEGGSGLDALARIPIQALGLDYLHGTGHGVGYVLSVHETPPSIRKKDGEPFAEGMIVSDEPGIYLEGQYGIRLENLLLCVPKGEMLGFEILSLVPFDRDAIEPSLMTADELAFLNQYHKTVYNTLSPYLTPEEAQWLKQATAPI